MVANYLKFDLERCFKMHCKIDTLKFVRATENLLKLKALIALRRNDPHLFDDTQHIFVGNYAELEKFLAGLRDGYPEFQTILKLDSPAPDPKTPAPSGPMAPGTSTGPGAPMAPPGRSGHRTPAA